MQNEEKPNQIYVTRLDRNTTEQDLRDKFSEFGTIKTLEVKHHRYCFIDYEETEAVQKAIAAMDGAKFVNGETLLVQSSSKFTHMLILT